MGNLGITAMPMVWLFFLFAWTASANQQTLIPPQEEFSVEISKQVQLDFEAIDPLHRSMQTDEDLGLCYDALFFADENQDRKVDKDEFITFVQLLSPPDFLADVGDFNDLPLILRSNFVILACLCLQGGTDPQCCVGPKAHISNKGAFPGEFPTSSQEQYLYLVCFLTKTSIDRVMQSMAPSLPPALAGTASPSAAITRSPVDDTTTPTSFPSAVASSAPSVMHSDGPSVSPSESPVAAPSTSPSYGPSAHPSKSPTPAPSKSPSRRPSNSPSELPSLYPSEEHSRGPSSPPSDLPSEILSPETRTPTSSWPTSSSDSPTVLLTATDSEYPSFIEDQGSEAPAIKETDPPSSGPSAAPTVTMQPTREVSMSPSSMSSELRPDAVAKVSYLVAVRDNFQMRDYVTDLVLAMDRLAPDVAFKLNISSTPDDVGRHLLVTVHVDLPTSVDGVILSSCPEFINENDRCEEVIASIGLFVGSDDPTFRARATTEFEADLDTAIRNKELQDALDEINNDSPVYIVSGMDSPDGIIDNDDESTRVEKGLSAGAVGGLIAVGLVGLIFLSVLLARGSRGQSEMYLKEGESVDVDEIQSPKEEISEQNENLEKGYLQTRRPTGSDNYVQFGMTKTGESKRPNEAKRFQVLAALPSTPEKRSDESSNAGDSGWSSHGGMSSLEDSSVDDSNFGLSLADIGVTSSLSQATAQDTETGTQSYSELDDAIQKGDWAAVGVTAALLASQSYETIQSQTSDGDDSKLPPKGSLNPSRAAELDRLVESGDWEGVVRAAAKYDAQESLLEQHGDSVTSRGGSSSSRVSTSGSVASATSSTGTGPSARSAFTSAGGTTVSDTNSRAKKLDEIRSEVELLVEHVVPEEKDNIDEMMLQFRGREEELVETLRSMQERQVAQKARLQNQKRAKRDARATVESNRLDLPSQQHLAVDDAGAPADESWMKEIENTPSDVSNTSSFGRLGIDQLEPPREEDEDNETKEMQEKLREAINNENWDVVAETASGLSDRFVDDTSIASSRDDSTSVSDRSQEINALVDKGDWEGVVAAASRYNETDQSVDVSSVDERRERRKRRLQEEEAALAQADIWNAIAEQTKSDTSQAGDVGAKEAADWAIARSLSELNKANERGGLHDELPSSGREEEREDEDDDEGSV